MILLALAYLAVGFGLALAGDRAICARDHAWATERFARFVVVVSIAVTWPAIFVAGKGR